MEQTDLHTCRTPARLAFADHMNRLVTGQGAPSTPERPEMLRAWAKPFGPLAKAIFHPLSSVLSRAARAINASWSHGFPDFLLASFRGFGAPGVRNDVIGFRCCCGSVMLSRQSPC